MIDGVLDDAVWREAQEISGFKTFIPDFSKDASERTSAYMAYDAENLYFAFRCHDRSPDRIKASMASRDTIMTDDFVCINLDSFNDRQALYAFYVNPLGIQGDSRFAGNVEDFSADFVWSSAGRLGPDGYTVEIAIPFKSIRYAGKERVEMAIFFERFISRISEHGSYPEMDPAKGYAFLSQMQPLELRDIRRATLLEVLPALVFNRRHEQAAGTPAAERIEGRVRRHGQIGIDLEAGPRPHLRTPISARSNRTPDRSTPTCAAISFLPRSGRSSWRAAKFSSWPASALSRRRAHPAHRRPALGFKLSGKLGKRDTLAAIFSLDEVRDDPLHAQAGTENAAFTIFRYKRALKDDSYRGSILHRPRAGRRFQPPGRRGRPAPALAAHRCSASTASSPSPTTRRCRRKRGWRWTRIMPTRRGTSISRRAPSRSAATSSARAAT